MFALIIASDMTMVLLVRRKSRLVSHFIFHAAIFILSRNRKGASSILLYLVQAFKGPPSEACHYYFEAWSTYQKGYNQWEANRTI